MELTVQDVMTPNPREVAVDEPIIAAAQIMRDCDVGDVVVNDGGQVRGILTDRDIVVRAIAEGMDPAIETVDAIYTGGEIVTVTPQTPLQEAVQTMSAAAVRRLPVVEDGRAVGIISLGDLALASEEPSALADISAAEPNNL